MRIAFEPSSLCGRVTVPSSKSLTHRALIAAAIAAVTTEAGTAAVSAVSTDTSSAIGTGISTKMAIDESSSVFTEPNTAVSDGAIAGSDATEVVEGICQSTIRRASLSQDIQATMDALRSLGAAFTLQDDVISVKSSRPTRPSCEQPIEINCCESGSTLRFLIPIVAALGIPATFYGRGKLPSRPITPYLEIFPHHGVTFDYAQTMPFSIHGRLTPGRFEVDGNISSQFISGLLFALPLLAGDSVIAIRGTLESRPYVELTLDSLRRAGIRVVCDGNLLHVPGNQRFHPIDYTLEGDFSQAAFFLVAGAIGSDVTCGRLPAESLQGDRQILNILRQSGAEVNESDDWVTVSARPLRPIHVDAADIPDLVPILAVLASFCVGESSIYNAARLRIKESDRLHAVSELLNRLGGKVTELPDGLRIEGVKQLAGGTVFGYNDHRIAMSAAVASIRSSAPVVLDGAECVDKSYPTFYEDFKALGGKLHVIDVE